MSDTRRKFLADVGKGMLVASLGPSLATEFGLSPAYADVDARLTFGRFEPLVALMQETAPERILPILVDRLRQGTPLGDLTAAAALANARTFGGEHYEGFHTFMALAPAYRMANELPRDRQALPVLKVLYRNAIYMGRVGGRSQEKLHAIEAPPLNDADASRRELRQASRQHDIPAGERAFAALSRRPAESAFNDLVQFNVEEHVGVHEVVLAWRAWETLEFVGREHAHTLLRQSVRQCTSGRRPETEPRETPANRVMALLDRHNLDRPREGRRMGDDAWVERLMTTILSSRAAEASAAVAEALAEGFSPEHVGEAIALAANQLVLRQVDNWEGVIGRRTHGDSMGVHASDAVNAWRNVARVGNPRNQATSLILAAGYVADSHRWSNDNRHRGHEREPYPTTEQLERITANDPAVLLRELEGAIRDNDQFRACALVHRYGAQGHPSRPVFDVLLRYAISEDGRLHGEKYYRTAMEEFASMRPAFRWRQVVALARVTASAFGYSREDRRGDNNTGVRAPGYEEACRLLNV
jgi:hypothetical protein